MTDKRTDGQKDRHTDILMTEGKTIYALLHFVVEAKCKLQKKKKKYLEAVKKYVLHINTCSIFGEKYKKNVQIMGKNRKYRAV